MRSIVCGHVLHRGVRRTLETLAELAARIYPSMQSIPVSLGQRSYPIWIGVPDAPDALVAALRDTLGTWSQTILVYDEHVAPYARSIAAALPNTLPGASLPPMLAVPSGEESKCVNELHRLWGELLRLRTDRQAVVIAVGGGVVGDLAGFLAATWNRGLRFVQVPTTLLAMVDSSVGGKTGINLPEAKNVVGAFWQPTLVWADLNALDSLPEREFRSGLAEVVKYGVILDPNFFAYLETQAASLLARDPAAIAAIVRRSCELKAQIVADDELETTGRRAILNYGHTFGHAIESLASYGTYLHGEAVAIGMTMAGTLAATLGRWPAESIARQTRLLHSLGLPTRIGTEHAESLRPKRMLEAMQLDKKTSHGKFNLILPTCIGQVETVREVPSNAIENAIAACLA